MKKEKETRTEEFIGGWSNAPSPAIFTVGQTAINCRVPISNTGCQLINICKKYNALQQLQKLNMILKTDSVVAETLKSSPNTSEITSFTSLCSTCTSFMFQESRRDLSAPKFLQQSITRPQSQVMFYKSGSRMALNCGVQSMFIFSVNILLKTKKYIKNNESENLYHAPGKMI